MCTLATCKQEIRVKAKVGDWLVGTGSAPKGLAGRLVYAMQVDEIVDFDTYWNGPQFAAKIPKTRGSRKQAYGDNIYHRDPSGRWIQADSRHSLADGSPNRGHVDRDTKANAVLIGRQFVYFGGDGPEVPAGLRNGHGVDLVHSLPAHRCRFPESLVSETTSWVQSLGTGIRGRPDDWK
jgi:hypothetical protein